MHHGLPLKGIEAEQRGTLGASDSYKEARTQTLDIFLSRILPKMEVTVIKLT